MGFLDFIPTPDAATGGSFPKAAAMLYGVGPPGVKRVWKFAAPGLRFLGKEDGLFVIEYHDESRHSENLPATTIDAYSVAFGHEIPHRVLHQFLP